MGDENVSLNVHPGSVSHIETPDVRLYINVKDIKDHTVKEVITRTTRKWETVEVDGLVLRRKRKLAPAAGTQAISKRQHHVHSPEASPQTAETPAQSPTAAQSPVLCQSTPQQPAAAASPAGSDRLQGEDAQEAALATVSNLVEALARPEEAKAKVLEAAPQTPEAATPDQQGCIYQPEAAVLSDEAVQELQQAVAACLPQGLAASERLIRLCDYLLQEQLQAAGHLMGEGTSHILTNVAETLPHALHAAMHNGSLQVHEHNAHDSETGTEGHAPKEPLTTVDWHQRKAVLQQQLASFQQEEAGWDAVMQDAQDLLESVPVQEDADGQQAAAGQLHLAAPAESGQLQQAQLHAQRTICLQVRGLAALVSGVEDLVGKAEQTCYIMQAQYHREKFRHFPHVESPARLIREIVRPSFRPAAPVALLKQQDGI